MIKYLVKGQNIETLEHEIIAADQIAFVKIHFVLITAGNRFTKWCSSHRTNLHTTGFLEQTGQAVCCRQNLRPVL